MLRRWFAPVLLGILTLGALTTGLTAVQQAISLSERYAQLDATENRDHPSLDPALLETLAMSRGGLLIALILCTAGVVLGLLHLFRARRREMQQQERETYFQTLLQNAADVIVLTDGQGIIRDISPAVERLLGIPADTARNTSCLDYAIPSDRERLESLLNSVVGTPGSSTSVETRVRNADGTWHNIEAITVNLLHDPVIGGLLMTVRDTTERRRTETALAEQEQLYALVAENSSDMIVLYGAGGETLYVSPAAMTVLGYTPAEYAALDPQEAVHPDDLSRVLDTRSRAFQGERMSVDFRIRQRSGEYIWAETRTQPILAPDGRVSQVQTSTRDITERVAWQEKMAYAAFHDQLTGLPNRAAIIRELQQHLSERGSPVSIFFLDVDNFKLINDTLGHQVGDQLLMKVADRVTALLQGDGMAGRLGGDEFVILRPGEAGDLDLRAAAEAAIQAINAPMALGGQTIHITPSIGILRSTGEHSSPEDLLRDAAVALHAAKKRGKACYTVFSADLQTLARDRLLLEVDLHRALEEGQFTLHYQPILTLPGHRIAGVEALLRWVHPTRGLVPPGEFIPLAEEIGLIVPLGAWVIEAACRQAVAWQRHPGGPRYISVNLSARQFQDPGLVDLVAATLQTTGLPPHLLQLEITESLSMADAEASIQVMRRLKRLGVRLAIDDFGTGYSSLKYLRQFPVDVLKLDRSFVSALGRDPEDVELVRTVVALGASLGLKVVAEGVETREQLAIITGLHCGSAQGFLLGKPVPQAEFELMLSRSTLSA